MIKILDCTLRDGGYVNDWAFGKQTIKKILKGLSDSNVDVIECGFLSSKVAYDENSSKFPTLLDMEKVLPEKSNATFVCMVNYGEFNANDLPDYNGGRIEGIRIAFHKHDLKGAEHFAKIAIKKGYKLFYQPMVTLNYSQEEFNNLIQSVNEIKPYAVYIVDSFGSMTPTNVSYYFEQFDKAIHEDVILGLHAHNNLQLAYSNALAMLNAGGNRQIIVDSSVYGMGRGAGNLCTELILSYLNKKQDANYNDMALLQIVDDCLMPIYTFSPWGYCIPYYISAIHNCHPNYASFLINKQTLSVQDINKIISKIPQNSTCNFDKSLIRSLYIDFQCTEFDDKKNIAQLSSSLKDKNVLVVAPGRSVADYNQVIVDKINDEKLEVVSVNFLPQNLSTNYVFIGNSKRLNSFDRTLLLDGKINLITTSNLDDSASLKVNYASLIDSSREECDNSGMMCLRLLKKCGVKKVYLAGFDGFDIRNTLNYVDNAHVLNVEKQSFSNKTEHVKQQLAHIKKYMDVEFITPSLYDN